MLRHLDLDSFLEVAWAPDFGGRAFRFDAFISHNRDDPQSRRLAEELGRRGAEVWHDDDRDLSDRRVQEAVGAALIQSRFVVVLIGAGFHDSIWCRAEYLPALAVETLASAKRVLVARMDADVAIPNDLAGATRFECHRDDEIERLRAVIVDGNRVPFEQAQVANQTTDWSDLRSRAEAFARLEDRENVKALMLSGVAGSVEAGDEPRIPQLLEAARTMFIDHVPLAELTADERQFLLDAARFFCTLRLSEDRANGIYMLQHLAEHDPERTLHDEVARVLEREPDATLMQIAFPWLEKQWDVLTPWQRSIAERCAMRAPSWLRDSPMVGAFAEVTRVKIFNRGLEIEALTCPERMHLLEERAGRILMSTQPITGDSNDDRLRAQLNVPDIEIVFRDLASLRREHRQHPSDEWPNRDAEVVTFIERIVRHSMKHEGFPILAMEDVDLRQFVLDPLLRFTAVPATRGPASKAYRDLCDLVEGSDPDALEVPVYREFLERALGGGDVSQGFYDPKELYYKLWRAKDEREGRKLRRQLKDL